MNSRKLLLFLLLLTSSCKLVTMKNPEIRYVSHIPNPENPGSRMSVKIMKSDLNNAYQLASEIYQLLTTEQKVNREFILISKLTTTVNKLLAIRNPTPKEIGVYIFFIYLVYELSKTVTNKNIYSNNIEISKFSIICEQFESLKQLVEVENIVKSD